MRYILSKGVAFTIKGLRQMLAICMRLDQKLNSEFNWATHNQKVVQSTRHYDMHGASDEAYYVACYWQLLEAFLTKKNYSKTGVFLDAGCGQGRLSIPLAKWCGTQGKVIGVDLSEHAILGAKKYAEQAQVVNTTFIADDLLTYLKAQKDNYFEGVLLLEIVFFLPNYQAVIKEIKRVLKPSGFFIGSFRSRYFNLLCCMQNGLWASVDTLLEKRSGRIMGGDLEFNWHTQEEIINLLASLNFKVDSIHGIGSCSGIPGDPHDRIKPSQLSKKELALLKKAELQVGENIPEAGRYFLVTSELESS